MSLNHSNTIFWQIRQIYKITIDRSNILYILDQCTRIKEQMKNDLSKGQDFKFVIPKEVFENENKEFFEEYFDGFENVIDYNQLIELSQHINSYIERITEYANKYKSLNKKITKHTKLYDVIEYLKLVEDAEHAKHAQTLDINNIADQIANRILSPPNNPTNTKGNKKLTARQMIDADRAKKSLKRKLRD